jgi:hypothetical protein
MMTQPQRMARKNQHTACIRAVVTGQTGNRTPTQTIIGRLVTMIRKLPDGRYRLYSRKKDPKTGKRRNLGTFKTRAAAEKHERAVQFFKRR